MHAAAVLVPTEAPLRVTACMQSSQAGHGAAQGSLSAQNSLHASSVGRTHSLRTINSAPATNEPLSLTTDRFSAAGTASRSPPGLDAPVAARLRYLHHQLNSFGAGSDILSGYKVLGELDRRQGGAHPCHEIRQACTYIVRMDSSSIQRLYELYVQVTWIAPLCGRTPSMHLTKQAAQ